MEKANAYCIAIPVGARIARMHFVQNFFLSNYCLWYVVSVKWSRTCMLSCPVSWTAKKPNWFYPGCYPDCFPALMMHDGCAASNRFPSAWIRRRRRPPENAVGANGRKINREIKRKSPARLTSQGWFGGLYWTRTVYRRPEPATGGGRRQTSIGVNTRLL